METLRKIILLSLLWILVPKSILAAVTFDPATCLAMAQAWQSTSDVQTWGNALLSDVSTMATNAWVEMIHAQQAEGDAWSKYVTYTMYNNLFDSFRQDTSEEYEQVKTNMAVIANAALMLRDVYVVCDDAPFFQPDPNTPGWALFTNPSTRSVSRWPAVDPAYSPCWTPGQKFIGYHTHYDRDSFADENDRLIVLCTRTNPNRPQMIRNLNIAPNTDISSLYTWSFTLFHELCHALINDMLGAATEELPAEQYGWDGAMELRSTYAFRNPDSHVLFALALTLNSWTWFTGWSKTRAESWAELLSDPIGPGIIDLWGLSDPSVPQQQVPQQQRS